MAKKKKTDKLIEAVEAVIGDAADDTVETAAGELTQAEAHAANAATRKADQAALAAARTKHRRKLAEADAE